MNVRVRAYPLHCGGGGVVARRRVRVELRPRGRYHSVGGRVTVRMGSQGSAKKKAKASEAPRRKAAEGKREATIRTAKDLHEFQRLRELMNEHSVASMAAIAAAPLAFGFWLLHPMMLRWVVPAALIWWCLRTVFVASACVPLALSWYATASYSSTLWRAVVVPLATMALQLGAMLLTTLFVTSYGNVDAKFKHVQAIAEAVDGGRASSVGSILSERSNDGEQVGPQHRPQA